MCLNVIINIILLEVRFFFVLLFLQGSVLAPQTSRNLGMNRFWMFMHPSDGLASPKVCFVYLMFARPTWWTCYTGITNDTSSVAVI